MWMLSVSWIISIVGHQRPGFYIHLLNKNWADLLRKQPFFPYWAQSCHLKFDLFLFFPLCQNKKLNFQLMIPGDVVGYLAITDTPPGIPEHYVLSDEAPTTRSEPTPVDVRLKLFGRQCWGPRSCPSSIRRRERRRQSFRPAGPVAFFFEFSSWAAGRWHGQPPRCRRICATSLSKPQIGQVENKYPADWTCVQYEKNML